MATKPKNWLIAILVLAAVLRLFNLSGGDPVNDEVFMSFRGLGMMDFDEAEAQTTPLEWFDPNIPWWTKLSFHDHPPLVFLIQNIFMRIFGESNFAFRLPSALLGIASVYLVYLLGRRMFSESAGLISSALTAVTLNQVYISRAGMQEAYVIFFLLLASYLFLKSLQEDKYLLWTGAALGLGILAKYNVFILVPVFLAYLLLFKREYFLNKKFWLGVLLALLIFSPVAVYNLMLCRAVGHFDFQFSYIFGQNPEVWQVAPGKEVGSVPDRIQNFIPRLIATNSWIFLILAASSILGFFRELFRKPGEIFKKYSLILIIGFWLLVLLLLIGPSYRFLTMLAPFLALGIGAQLSGLINRKVGIALAAVILIFEVFYSWNNQIADYPVGPAPWLSSKVRFENYNWGYNQLGQWLDRELKGKMPALTFDLRYKFLENLRDRAIEKGLAGGLEPYPALLVYDGNFDKAAKLWVLDRLHIYHGWPVISLKTYYDYLLENGFDYYGRSGFTEKYFIFQANIVPSPESRQLMRGAPIEIKNLREETAFQIYRF